MYLTLLPDLKDSHRNDIHKERENSERHHHKTNIVVERIWFFDFPTWCNPFLIMSKRR